MQSHQLFIYERPNDDDNDDVASEDGASRSRSYGGQSSSSGNQPGAATNRVQLTARRTTRINPISVMFSGSFQTPATDEHVFVRNRTMCSYLAEPDAVFLEPLITEEKIRSVAELKKARGKHITRPVEGMKWAQILARYTARVTASCLLKQQTSEDARYLN